MWRKTGRAPSKPGCAGRVRLEGVFGLLVVYATKGLGLSAHSSLIGLFYTAAALGGLASAAYACWLGRRFSPIRATLFAQTAN
jgi:hypothetical protein